MAQKELEELAAIGYKDLVLASNPGTSADPKDPRSGVSGSQYRPSSDVRAPGPLDQLRRTPPLCAPTRSWSEDGMSGTVYRFVTKGPSGSCGTNLPQARDRRGHDNTAAGNQPDPVTASTVVTEAAEPERGREHRRAAARARAVVADLLPDRHEGRTAAARHPRGAEHHHVVHESDKFPDLMVTDPPPDPTTERPGFCHRSTSSPTRWTSTRPRSSRAGGSSRRRATATTTATRTRCTCGSPSRSPTTVTLTGKFIGSVYTQILGQTPGNVILCATVYKVTTPLKATGGSMAVSPSSTAIDCSGQMHSAQERSRAIPGERRRPDRPAGGVVVRPVPRAATPSSTRSARTSASRSRCP